jgi:hypothetical protein
MSPADCLAHVIKPAFARLPGYMDSERARVLVLAIMMQESGLRSRWQVLEGGAKGPARGLAQFERGSKAGHSGVWGVYLHHATHEHLRLLCRDVDCNFDPAAIWAMLEHDDVLAAGVARLLLYTDPYPIPVVGDEAESWAYYLRTWRPGRPHPERWPASYDTACAAVADA